MEAIVMKKDEAAAWKQEHVMISSENICFADKFKL